MIDFAEARIHLRMVALGLLLIVAAAALSGCQSIGYYNQAIQGQYRILARRRPINQVLADPQTTEALKEKLRLVLQVRAFAEQDLKLPVNAHYLRYVDLHRRFVVWNVHAAPELSIKPKTWWYPVVGRLKYRGYFSEQEARRYAEKLDRKGFDVYVEGVEAYSTLGWFADPVLSTFIHHDASELAEITLHELAHQRLFVAGDTDFNEAFATAVAQEGVRRWLRRSAEPMAAENYRRSLEHNDQFVDLIMKARAQLESLYGDQNDEQHGNHSAPRQSTIPTTGKRQGKQIVIGQLREEWEQLKAHWGGHTGYDNWFARSLNNAQLNTIATYYRLVPGFDRLVEANGGDLEKFYQAVRSLAKLSKKERQRRLVEFGAQSSADLTRAH